MCSHSLWVFAFVECTSENKLDQAYCLISPKSLRIKSKLLAVPCKSLHDLSPPLLSELISYNSPVLLILWPPLPSSSYESPKQKTFFSCLLCLECLSPCLLLGKGVSSSPGPALRESPLWQGRHSLLASLRPFSPSPVPGAPPSAGISLGCEDLKAAVSLHPQGLSPRSCAPDSEVRGYGK